MRLEVTLSDWRNGHPRRHDRVDFLCHMLLHMRDGDIDWKTTTMSLPCSIEVHTVFLQSLLTDYRICATLNECGVAWLSRHGCNLVVYSPGNTRCNSADQETFPRLVVAV